MNTSERFWAKVDVVHDWSSCWNWTAAKLPRGYGRFGLNGGVILAHRMAYQLAKGTIPNGAVVDHVCHNTSCVRPSHLRAVTNKQNIENRGHLNENNKTGVRGVTVRNGRYRASVKHNRRAILDREYDTLEEAANAATAARLKVFTHNDLDRAIG